MAHDTETTLDENPGETPRATFARMDESTRDDWMRIATATVVHQPAVPQAILAMLRSLEGLHAGFQVDQLHHALQTATMAERAGASDEVVVAALCHDIGKTISISNHGPIAAEILKPYVSEDIYHVIRTHQDFQGRHYYGHFDMSTTLRDQYRAERWFSLAEQFTDAWDQAAFDPSYDIEPLEHFEARVHAIFGTFAL